MLKLSKSTIRFLKYGAPMMLFMLAGSYGLSEFTDIRVKKKEERVRQLTVEESQMFKKKKNVESLEDMFDGMKEGVNIEEWENKRGPRVWEEETLKMLPTYKSKTAEEH